MLMYLKKKPQIWALIFDEDLIVVLTKHSNCYENFSVENISESLEYLKWIIMLLS